MLESQKSKRYRSWEAVRTYSYETHEKDENGELIKISDISESEWKEKVIKELSAIKSENDIWFIFHDKDRNSEGELKTLHVHIVALYKNGKTYTSVMNDLKCQERQLNVVRSQAGVFRYLTHTTDKAMNEKKYRYDIDELHYYSLNKKIDGEKKREVYTEKIVGKEARKENEEEFIAQLKVKAKNGEVLRDDLPYEFEKEFGEERGTTLYGNNESKLLIAVEQFKRSYLKDKRDNGRKLVTIYIEGGSGLGKTTLGRLICQYENRLNGFDKNDYFDSAGVGKGITKDVFQSYKMEYSSLLDEYMPEQSLNFSTFNKIFQNDVVAQLPSRKENKTWYSDLCVISKSRDIDEMINSLIMTAENDEKAKYMNCYHQIARRIPINLKLFKDKIEVYLYNKENMVYELHSEYIGDIQDQEFLIDFLKNIHILIEEVRSTIDKNNVLNVDLI